MISDKLILACLIIATIIALPVTLLPVLALWNSPWLLVNIVVVPMLFSLLHRLIFDMLMNGFAEDSDA